MDYTFKANVTTILSTYLIPLLVGWGLSYESSNAIIGLIVTALIIGFNMLNERYTSDHLTQPKCEVEDGTDSERA